MSNQQSGSDSNTQHHPDQLPRDWRNIYKGVSHDLFAHSWAQNILVSIALLFLAPAVGLYLMKDIRGILIGFGLGVTILFWIIWIILIKQFAPVAIESGSDNAAKGAVTPSPAISRSDKPLTEQQRRDLREALKDFRAKGDKIGIWFPEGDLPAYELAQSIRDALREAQFTQVLKPSGKAHQTFQRKRKRSDLGFTRLQKPEDYNAVSILATAFSQIGYSVDVKPVENLAETFEIYVQPSSSKPDPRPLIQLKGIDFSFRDKDETIIITCTAENIGDARADDVVFICRAIIVDKVLTEALELEFRPEMPRSTLPENRPLQKDITVSGVTNEVMRKLNDREVFLYVFGLIFYTDWPSSVQHSFRFGARYDPATKHFDYTAFHNKSD